MSFIQEDFFENKNFEDTSIIFRGFIYFFLLTVTFSPVFVVVIKAIDLRELILK